jgi:hypothetical protein
VLPQVTPQGPQSLAHVVQSSPISQEPLPQVGQAPQSAAQVLQLSPVSQRLLPQVGVAHEPQSLAQVEHVSPLPHRPSPHPPPQISAPVQSSKQSPHSLRLQ